MQLELIDDARRFEALREEWNALLAASPADGLFLTWEWLATWWKHLSAGARLHILAVRSGGDLVAIAPFLLRRRRAPEAPFPVLEFLGTGSVGSDYLDLIIRSGAEAAVVGALADHLEAAQVALRLTRLRAGASAARLAVELARRGWRCDAADTEVCPYARLPAGTWESYLATLNSDHRIEIRRRLNNLHKQFDVRFEQVTTDDDRRAALATLMALHDARRQDRGGSTAFHTPLLRSFHAEFSQLAQEQGWLRLFTLRLDGRPVAAQYGFRYRQTFYDYQKGFDPGFSRHAVGAITTGLTIKSAIESGVEEYDFLHGDEAYKFRWARDVRRLGRLEMFTPGARGAVCRWLVTGGRRARRAARRLLGDVVAERLVGQRG